MPNERVITDIESILSQVIELGAEKERTRLGPNLLVTDAAPTGLANYILVRDDRDGDNILALKVPGVVYNTNDLVNVLFVRGGEAIAFQQGSGSASSDIWGIVSGTSTDIFYNSGDVGIGKSIAPDARLELLDAAQAQLRLTHTEDVDFVDFQIDTNADLTITPSGTGQIILQPTTDSTDFFQVLDADGGTPVLNVDSTNERVGIGTATPTYQLDVAGDAGINEFLYHNDDANTYLQFTDDQLDLFVGGLNILRADEAAQDVLYLGDIGGAGDVDIDFNNSDMFFEGATGNLAIGNTSPANKLHIESNASGQQGIRITNTSSAVNASASIEFFNGAGGGDRAFFLATGGSYTAVSGWQDTGVFSCQSGLSGGMVLSTVAAGGIKFEVGGNGSSFQQAVIDGTGLGLGVTSPQARAHGYDAIGGFLQGWIFDGLNATVREIIPNGTGDCLYRLHAEYVLRDSAGAVASGTTDVSNSASVNLTVGGNTVRLRVNADGSIDVARTAGSDTIKVIFNLLWL